ncbi:MAG: nucleoside deaminase [Prolixibacteraceae bacterium]|nr:nucleoside deaminase [Prolixibacteraceae bacterium]
MIQPFSDEYFMQKALNEAEQAFNSNEVPIGCVVVCNNRIIARAHNLTETLTDVTAHAEIQAITSASDQLGGKYLTDCTIYVTVEPCTMCAGALGWAQVKKIVYGASDAKKGFTKIAPNSIHPKTKIIKGILETECSSLMKLFFSKRRKL